ncbi:O-antigen ligase family protein [Hufsiella ginkgonis]|uniref:O-antigen ligase-related domain-containing protein n=1 Tax=Hufsiella ginkgonis TaxID=2695274 RepID=A0A7K1Y3Y4_9SPHI|nr:O-antigen ligase family protein [Hufsiella ginkgonis]MXV17406.1 hypothetical protein [Hufsiella ginkgonis]
MKFLKNFDLNYFITLFFLLLSSNANFLVVSTPIWYAIFGIFLVIAIYQKRFEKKDLVHIAIFTGVYLLVIAFRDTLLNELDTDYLVADYLFLVRFIYLSFIYCMLLKERLLANIVKVMTHLTVVSFFFYAFQLLSSDNLFAITSSLKLPNGNDLPGYSNIVIYTYTQGFHDFSNSGFVWEPGAFGCFLVISLMFHFFLNKFSFDATAVILIIGNITAFSTTNYLALIILFFLVYRYRVPRINIWVLILIPSIIIAFFTIPFLADKIVATYKEDMDDLNNLRVLERWYRHHRMQVPLNRFSSAVYIWDNFGDKMFLGVTNRYNDILNKQYKVNISNGLFDFLAKFGIAGLLYFLYRYLRFCAKFMKNGEQVIYCLLIILVASFGEPILAIPFTLIFLFVTRDQVRFSSINLERTANRKKILTP